MDFPQYNEMSNRVNSLINTAPEVKDGVEMGIIMEHFLNSMDNDRVQDFLDYMTNFAHRTLQQKYFGLVLNSIEKFASMENFDDRNAASVNKATRIKQFMEENNISTRLPLV